MVAFMNDQVEGLHKDCIVLTKSCGHLLQKNAFILGFFPFLDENFLLKLHTFICWACKSKIVIFFSKIKTSYDTKAVNHVFLSPRPMTKTCHATVAEIERRRRAFVKDVKG